MLRYVLLAYCFASFVLAQSSPAVTVTSTASASIGLAPESLATASGTNLATQTAKAPSVPLPTKLGGIEVQVSDSAFVARSAGLIYVSPTQINFVVPAGTAPGAASVRIVGEGPPIVVPVQIRRVAPGLLSINTLGIAAATAIRVVIASRMQAPVPVFQCVDTPGSCRLMPMNLGVDTPVYLSLYGSGIRGRSSLANVVVTIGRVSVTPLYAGPQSQFPGLDQVVVPLPLSLRGAGQVNVTVTVDGVASNPVQIEIA